jgi:peptidoglycan/xylan/chitin deacetylase (PgdA/CDA1 family)
MGQKEKIALLLDKLYIGKFLFNFSRFIYGSHIRVVNYHSTPPHEMDNFEAQLKVFQQHYSSVSYGDLVRFFETGKWHKAKPGLIISFDDGLRDNVDYAVPLLDKYNFKGWFFIPSGLIDANSAEQMEFVGKTENRYKVNYPDGRYLMSWEEIKDLYDNHVIGCHTFSHHRMNIKDSDQLLTKEIVTAKVLMEKMLQKPVSIYCWVGGEEHTYTREAAKKIKEAGYLYSFMTNTYPLTPGQSPLQIQRTNIETRNPMFLVRFQLSIIMDSLYRGKRKRVNKLTNVAD